MFKEMNMNRMWIAPLQISRRLNLIHSDVEIIPQLMLIGTVLCYGSILAVFKLMETVYYRPIQDVRHIDIDHELELLEN